MNCLVCGAVAEVGGLCRECVQQVSPSDGLIPEHIRSTVTGVDADAWLVDGFGQAHAVGPKSLVGRIHEGQIVILAEAVSRNHAELRSTETGWTVRDVGSHNGTSVDGTKCQGRVALAPRSIVRFGDVAMWFLTELVDEPQPHSNATMDLSTGIIRFEITPTTGPRLLLFGTNDGGALMCRGSIEEKWGGERQLPQLEFQFLRALSIRACAEADVPAVARGCVPTKQLANDLPFKTRFANEENVRQVVRRLRGALLEIGVDRLVEVQPGRGYYLRAEVKIST